ncbi:MAG TPA: DUF503 domain-containing protein [Virgibacillus sp.]|nr:DUF503 domain-containing protein [Virgibacillus sp.]
MIVYVEVECMFYEGRSLKQKRSTIKSIGRRLRNDFNVTVAEIDYHDLWQRTKLGIATISNDRTHGEKVIQEALKRIDAYVELERTITEWEIM